MLLKIAGERRVKLCFGNTWIDSIGYSPISLQLLNGFDSQEYSATVFTNTHYVENLEVERIYKCKSIIICRISQLKYSRLMSIDSI